jgi:GGDEF domain-containing protein
MDILDTMPTILIVNNEVTLNDKAKEEFKNQNITHIIDRVNLKKEIEIISVGNELYAVNILKDNYYLLLFTKITNVQSLLTTTRNDEKNREIEIYSKYMLQEFLEKFLALKRRYGGFSIKFLYLKIDFTIDVAESMKKRVLNSILKYSIAITRSSDVVGEISENSFGIILTNPSSEGATIISEKINSYIAEMNIENGKRVIEVYGVTVHELFLLKYMEFNKIIKEAEENARFIRKGMRLRELM